MGAASSPPPGLFRERRERLRRQGGGGLLALIRGDAPFYEDLYYLTGLETYQSGLLIDMATGEEFVFVWPHEHAEAAEQTDVEQVLRVDDPAEFLTREVVRRSPGSVFLGASSQGASAWAVEVAHKLSPEAEIQDAGSVIAPLRRIKDAYERRCLAEADAVAGWLVEDAVSGLRAGVTERDLAACIVAGLVRAGSRRPALPIVAFGDHTARAHHVPTDRALRPGDVVLVDIFGEACGRYCADRTETLVFDGENAQAARRIKVVREVLEALLGRARPGVSPREIESHAGMLFTALGFRQEYPGACVHDVGLSEHDPTDKEEPLAPGQVLAIEPGLYNRDLGLGVRREQVVEVQGD